MDMTLAELVRLTERDSYKILFVNGEPPVFRDSGASLRADGYVVETMAGPDLSGIVSVDQILTAMFRTDLALLGQIDAARNAIPDIFARNPQFVFFNYARKEEADALYTFAHGMAHQQERGAKLCSIDEPDYTTLRLAIDVGRARRLYHHDFADFSRRLRSVHCRDHNAILSAYSVIGDLLQRMSRDEPDGMDLEQLQRRLDGIYHAVQQAKPSLAGPQHTVLAELGWRVMGISTILYGCGPRVADSEPREERMIGIGN